MLPWRGLPCYKAELAQTVEGWAAQGFGEPGPLPNLSTPCSFLSSMESQPVPGSALSTAEVHMRKQAATTMRP